MARLPAVLYKYLGFSERLLSQLLSSEVYFAGPGTFNDPLDCQPIVVPDIDSSKLKMILARLISLRVERELEASLKRLSFQGDAASKKINLVSQREIPSIIRNIEYMAHAPEVEDRELFIRDNLVDAIAFELRKTYVNGLFCLSESHDDPLMWSHYGDQHRGICLEYDTSDLNPATLYSVKYGEPREISASVIWRWLIEGSESARRQIEVSSFRAKASGWEYEREWRLTGAPGLGQSKIHLRSIIFGLRCDLAIKYTVVSAFTCFNFYEMRETGSGFFLERVPLDKDTILVLSPTIMANDFQELPPP